MKFTATAWILLAATTAPVSAFVPTTNQGNPARALSMDDNGNNQLPGTRTIETTMSPVTPDNYFPPPAAPETPEFMQPVHLPPPQQQQQQQQQQAPGGYQPTQVFPDGPLRSRIYQERTEYVEVYRTPANAVEAPEWASEPRKPLEAVYRTPANGVEAPEWASEPRKPLGVVYRTPANGVAPPEWASEPRKPLQATYRIPANGYEAPEWASEPRKPLEAAYRIPANDPSLEYTLQGRY